MGGGWWCLCRGGFLEESWMERKSSKVQFEVYLKTNTLAVCVQGGGGGVCVCVCECVCVCVCMCVCVS